MMILPSSGQYSITPDYNKLKFEQEMYRNVFFVCFCTILNEEITIQNLTMGTELPFSVKHGFNKLF